jgi:hypothetical protein
MGFPLVSYSESRHVQNYLTDHLFHCYIRIIVSLFHQQPRYLGDLADLLAKLMSPLEICVRARSVNMTSNGSVLVPLDNVIPSFSLAAHKARLTRDAHPCLALVVLCRLVHGALGAECTATQDIGKSFDPNLCYDD